MRLFERWLTRWHERQHEEPEPIVYKLDTRLTAEQVEQIRERFLNHYRKGERREGRQ